MRERRKKDIGGRWLQNICAAVTCGNVPERNATCPEAILYVNFHSKKNGTKGVSSER